MVLKLLYTFFIYLSRNSLALIAKTSKNDNIKEYLCYHLALRKRPQKVEKMKLCTNSITKDISRWVNSYIKTLHRDEMAENTIAMYESVLERFSGYIKTSMKGKKITDINSDVILEFIEHIEQEHGSPYSTTTRSLYILIIKLFFVDFIESKADLLPDGTQYTFKREFDDIITPRGRKAKKRVKFKHLGEDEVVNLLDYLDTQIEQKGNHYDYVYALSIRLMLYGGLRVSEMLQLKLDDLEIDKERGIVEVRLLETKSGEEQYVPIRLSYIERELSYLISFAKISKIDKSTAYLFSSKRMDKPMTRHNLYRKVNLLYKKVGISKSGLHILRHTSAMMLLDKTGDITYVQALLRHASINTTTVYAKRSVKKLGEHIV